MGFEPTVGLLLHSISNAAPSTARTPVPDSESYDARLMKPQHHIIFPEHMIRRNERREAGFRRDMDQRSFQFDDDVWWRYGRGFLIILYSPHFGASPEFPHFGWMQPWWPRFCEVFVWLPVVNKFSYKDFFLRQSFLPDAERVETLSFSNMRVRKPRIPIIMEMERDYHNSCKEGEGLLRPWMRIRSGEVKGAPYFDDLILHFLSPLGMLSPDGFDKPCWRRTFFL